MSQLSETHYIHAVDLQEVSLGADGQYHVGYRSADPPHAEDGTQCWCRPDVVYQDGSHPSGQGQPGEWLPQDDDAPIP
jgi:hypothetical protein